MFLIKQNDKNMDPLSAFVTFFTLIGANPPKNPCPDGYAKILQTLYIFGD